LSSKSSARESFTTPADVVAVVNVAAIVESPESVPVCEMPRRSEGYSSASWCPNGRMPDGSISTTKRCAERVSGCAEPGEPGDRGFE